MGLAMMTPTVRKGLLVVIALAAALAMSGCVPSRVAPNEYDQTAPATDGLTVVWEDSRNTATAGTDIYMFDTQTSTETLVAGGNGDQDQPAISNGFIVWIDNGRLRAKNRSSGQVFNVTTGGATQSDPALCGSVVTWTDTRNATSDVYARNLAGGSEIAVATTSTVEAYPACDAGRIVYMRSASNEWASIRLFDLASGQTTVVTDEPWNEWQPAISGDRVVWQAWPNQPDTTDGHPDQGHPPLDRRGLRRQRRARQPDRAGDLGIGGRLGGRPRRRYPAVVARPRGDEGRAAGHDGGRVGVQRAPALFSRGLVYQSDPTGAWNVFRIPLLNQ